jgi:hypothetical protein
MRLKLLKKSLSWDMVGKDVVDWGGVKTVKGSGGDLGEDELDAGDAEREAVGQEKRSELSNSDISV